MYVNELGRWSHAPVISEDANTSKYLTPAVEDGLMVEVKACTSSSATVLGRRKAGGRYIRK